MSGGTSMHRVLAVAATAVILVQVVMAETVTVGGVSGWKVPTSPDFYSSWAAEQSFAVDDILEFTFTKAIHTVAQVTSKEAYESCDATLDSDAKIYDSTVEVTLTKEGTYYFFCTLGSHCASGQKLSVTVGSTAATLPPTVSPPASSPPASSPPAPADNSAHGVSALPVSFMAAIISLVVLARVIT